MKVARRAGTERGATIFVVLLVLTLLTTIGLFSVRAATRVTIAAGNHRQALQSLYFAEGAAALGVAQIGGPQSNLYVDLIYTSQDTCSVNAALASTDALGPNVRAPCYRIYSTEVATRVQSLSQEPLFEPQSTTAPGSFGPTLAISDVTTAGATNAGREGLFVIELTDAFEGPPPAGFNVDDPAFRSITLNLTAFSQLRNTPSGATTNEWCGSLGSAPTASIQAVRAYVTLPMVSK